ncbi:hypothetical protein ACFOLA_12660 [Salinicoccus hispanicus]|uniref:Uncharacterized protein n=1 Tax=Salinicoccus hispanicus TaxID=157225 RepID=A0A6N8TYX2_9STAP|nr:hypothetical protein [Salinicoccus hispanicus]MXQ50672.1 hypothetical protein [Salinicoccus hispanicus]
MNDKVKKAVTLLPVVLVPLFNERNRIKKHPDVQKISATSNTIYHSAKDKSASAAQSVKSASTSTYQTGRTAISKVGDAVEDRRVQHTYKKEQKQYQKSLQQEESLLKQFEKEKEKHRKQRLKEQSAIPVPKILQSGSDQTHDNDDKSHAMTVDDAYRATEVEMPETKAEMKSNPDNYGIATEYSDDQANNRASLTDDDEERLDINAETADDAKDNNGQERFDHMDQNINYWIDKKVKGHESDGFENGELFTKHKNKLDPKHAVTAKKETEWENSLFNRHRGLQETRVSASGRKTGEPGAVTKSRRQKKLEKKIEKHRKKQYN